MGNTLTLMTASMYIVSVIHVFHLKLCISSWQIQLMLGFTLCPTEEKSIFKSYAQNCGASSLN